MPNRRQVKEVGIIKIYKLKKIMKRFNFIAVITLMAIAFTACGAKKQVAQSSAPSGGANPFGETYSMPCEVYDTPQEFAATGIFRGSSNQKGEVQKYALLNAQELVRLKMKHAYKGMVSEYASSVGNNQGNDIEHKITSAGDRIIDDIINETAQSCTRWSAVESDGHITCYTAIQISKQETAQKIAQEVKDKLSQEEKDRIGFNEQEYRKQMEQRFQQYKEEHK